MSETFDLYQVDAFSDKVFGGNPAAVVPLKDWLPAEVMQKIAQENYLAETAFFVPDGENYHLRWFTPTNEIELCGHATLASAFVLFNYLEPQRQKVTFNSLSGPLHVSRDQDMIVLNFPALPPKPCAIDPNLLRSLRLQSCVTILAGTYYLVVLESEEQVAALKPNFTMMRDLDRGGVIVTAPGKISDCASRFFAPGHGIPEDPVTGAAHCTIVPYWSEKLGKATIHARQISARTGELFCRNLGERVELKGNAVLYLKGTFSL